MAGGGDIMQDVVVCEAHDGDQDSDHQSSDGPSTWRAVTQGQDRGRQRPVASHGVVAAGLPRLFGRVLAVLQKCEKGGRG